MGVCIDFENGTPVQKQRSSFPYSFDTYVHDGVPLSEIKESYKLVYHDHLKHPSAHRCHNAVSIPMAELILKEEFGADVKVFSVGVCCHQMHGHAINVFAYKTK